MPPGNDTITITVQAVDQSTGVLQATETRVVAIGNAGATAAPKLAQARTQLEGIGRAGATIPQQGNLFASLPGGAGSTGGSGQLDLFGIAQTTRNLDDLKKTIPTVPPLPPIVPPDLPPKLAQAKGNIREVGGELRELGVRGSYTFKHLIADNETLMAGMRALGAVFIAISLIEIGKQIFEGIHHLYEEWINVSSAIKDYQLKAGEAAQQKLVDTSSLETAISLLRQAQDEVDNLEAKRKTTGVDGSFLGNARNFLNRFGPGDYNPSTGRMERTPVFTPRDDQHEAEAATVRDAAQQRTSELQHQSAEMRLKGEEAYNSAALAGYAKIAAAERDRIANAQIQLAYTKEQEQTHQKITEDALALQKAQGVSPDKQIKVYHADPNAGNAQYEADVNAAHQGAAGSFVAARRSETEAVISMQNEAVNAGLRGEALYAAQRQEAIDAVTRKFQQGELSKQGAAAETAAVNQKFDNESLRRQEEINDRISHMQREASTAGLTGLPKIQADQQAAIGDFAQGAIKGGYSPAQIAQGTAAIEQKTDAEILHARQQLSDRLAQLDQHSADYLLSGYAKIEGQTKASLRELERSYTEFYGSDQAKWQGYQQHKTDILLAADRERLKYTQDIDRQISETEAEAARLGLAPWEQAQQKIIDDYQLRLQKIREDEDQQLAAVRNNAALRAQIEAQAGQQVVAAWHLANAQMQQESLRVRDQIAGNLQSLFDNPAHYLQERAKKLMFDILANWLTQMTESKGQFGSTLSWLLGVGAPTSTSTNPATVLGGIFGGRQHRGGETLGLPNETASLNSAGSTLSSSGTVLYSAGTNLNSAANALQIAAQRSSVGGGGVSGGIGGGGLLDQFTGGAGFAGGGEDIPSQTSALPIGGGAGGALSSAASAGASVAGGAGAGEVGQSIGLLGSLASGGTFGSGAQSFLSGGSTAATSSAPLLNPGGGIQPTDINVAPTNAAGVPGTVPEGGAAPSGSSLGASAGIGIGLAALTGGIALAQDWKQGNTGAAVLQGAVTGASIGSFFGPIGAGVGAGIGALVGFIGSLFSDHGASKARKFNREKVQPAIQQEMFKVDDGQADYQSAQADLNNQEQQAEQQCKQWGSGAVGVFQRTIMPEFDSAIAQIQYLQQHGRQDVTQYGAAQFHQGGPVVGFGSFATSSTEGFIHARMGEHVLNEQAATTNAPWLRSLNSGLDISSTLGSAYTGGVLRGAASGVPQETGAANSYASGRGSASSSSGGTGNTVVINLSSWDAKDVARALRGGLADQIQDALNSNAGRYSGRAVGSF